MYTISASTLSRAIGPGIGSPRSVEHGTGSQMGGTETNEEVWMYSDSMTQGPEQKFSEHKWQ
jgi:hypothetical protein